MTAPRRKRWKRVLLVSFAALAGIYALTGPYVFPVDWGLGPCFKDWTSPSSYLPRISPLTTVDGVLDGGAIRVCYGAPAARGRTLFGDEALVPYGRYWRTGANEPTRLFTNRALRLAGLEVPPGRYSIYTLPGAEVWEVIVNRSTFHWGYDFSESVVSQELGRVSVVPSRSEVFVETFRIEWRDPPGAGLTMSWGDVSLWIPVEVAP